MRLNARVGHDFGVDFISDLLRWSAERGAGERLSVAAGSATLLAAAAPDQLRYRGHAGGRSARPAARGHCERRPAAHTGHWCSGARRHCLVLRTREDGALASLSCAVLRDPLAA